MRRRTGRGDDVRRWLLLLALLALRILTRGRVGRGVCREDARRESGGELFVGVWQRSCGWEVEEWGDGEGDLSEEGVRVWWGCGISQMVATMVWNCRERWREVDI